MNAITPTTRGCPALPVTGAAHLVRIQSMTPSSLSLPYAFSPTSSPMQTRQRRCFQSTHQDAAYSQLRPRGRAQHVSHVNHPFTQHQTSPRRSNHDMFRMAFSSSAETGQANTRSEWSQKNDMVFDEDVIVELRPIFEERARPRESWDGRQTRAMDTGKGEEWVW